MLILAVPRKLHPTLALTSLRFSLSLLLLRRRLVRSLSLLLLLPLQSGSEVGVGLLCNGPGPCACLRHIHDAREVSDGRHAGRSALIRCMQGGQIEVESVQGARHACSSRASYPCLGF